jgi:large subunit ribosomal protein L10
LNREQKSKVVQLLGENLAKAQVVVVVEYKGMNAASVFELRKQLRAKGATFAVVKNTLLARAVAGTNLEGLNDLAGGPIAVAYTAADAAGLAKDLTGYARKEEKLIIRGGMLGGKKIGVEEVKDLATLPSIEVLRSKLLGLLQTPAQQFLGILLAAPRNFLGVLKAREDKLSNTNA